MLRCVERDVLQQPLHHRVKPPRADILGLLVDLPCDLRQPPDRLGPELELYALRRKQRLVLAHETGVGVGEDLLEIGDGETRELDANGKAPLQLRYQVRGL